MAEIKSTAELKRKIKARKKVVEKKVKSDSMHRWAGLQYKADGYQEALELINSFEAWVRKYAPPNPVDALEIVNDFSMHPIEVPTCPINIGTDPYWGEKLCALAARCADAENKLRSILEGEGGDKGEKHE